MIETLNWGSHLPALMSCVAVCNGPVLEIGCGNFSTPCLHALCSTLKLPLVTTEVHDSWREQFMYYDGPNHRLFKQSDKLLADLATRDWGVVFIDDDADNRLGHLDLFYDAAKFIVFHDASFPQYAEPTQKWVAEKQCNHKIYTLYGPHTLVVSKNHDIPDFQ